MRKSMVRRGCCWLLTMAFVVTTLLVVPFGALAEDDAPKLELLATIPINDVAGSNNADDADGAYIYSYNGSTFDTITGYRWCDNAEELIYQFKLSEYDDLVVETELGGNYVLEAAGSLGGPWTMIADWKVIGGGERAGHNDKNKATYYTHFSRLGVTGEMGYLRLSNMDRSGGWGGTIWTMKLYNAVKEASPIEKIIAAIDAIGSDAVSLANYSVKVQAVRTAQTAYDAWKANNPQADDAQITNLAKLTAVRAELDTFLDQYDFFPRKTYSPNELLAMAEKTSVKPEGFDALVGVTHAASGKLYDGIASDAVTINYSYKVVTDIPVNDAAQSDAPYIYSSNAENWLDNERFCDNNEELIYKFNLADYTDLAVQTDLGANYVLEAAASPEGPWTMIADYGVIGGGIRAPSAENRAFYTVHFSALGITGETGYIRLSNVDRAGGWGGAIFGMKLMETTTTSEPFVRPGDQLRLEVDFAVPSPSGDNLLTAAARNGKFGLSLSLNSSAYEALTEKKDSTYGYAYRTAVATVTLPTSSEDAAIEQALKDSGFALSVESAAVGCTVYRISLVDATNGRTLISLSEQSLLDAAQASSNPSACMLCPVNFETFDHVVALRSPDGEGWYSVNYLESPYQDWRGRPLCHAGDEIEYVFHVFYEDTDTIDLPDGHALRLIAVTGKGIEIGRPNNDDAIVLGPDYNELELIEDGRYDGHPYKEYTGSFVIPDDEESEAVVQSNGFRISIGTHLNKDDYPLVIYGVTMTNLTTNTEIISATAEDFRFTNYENTREEITDGSLGGLKAPLRGNYAPSTLLCSDEEELEVGTYSYSFRYATMMNKAKEKAVLSVLDEDGNVLASQTVTAVTSGRYDTQPVIFTLTEKAKVHCKVELCNGSDFYLREISLNDLVTQEELQVREVISTIEQLPAADAITLADKKKVSIARISYNRLSEEQRALVTNYNRLTAAEDAIIHLYQEAADEVIAKINALPATITLENETAIVEARNAYKNLASESKDLVTNISVLDEAEKALAVCKEQAVVDAVIERINALPEKITQNDKAAIYAARKAYNGLSEVQKKLVTNLAKLEAAEKELEIKYGDINGDGNIDASDALIALQHSVRLTTLDGDRFTAADVNQNGTVDASDALYILQYSVHLIDTLPVAK